MSLRTTLAVSSGKLTSALIEQLHLGAGTSLPGKVARWFAPDLLKQLAQQIQGPRIGVTGTNGKTTTCGLLACCLEAARQHVVHNQLGANMVPGITAALMQRASILGKLSVDAAVLEVDEASFQKLTPSVSLTHLVVTNLFRDQLDRYGELDTTARMIARGIEESPNSTLFLNADDPLVAQLANQERHPVQYFGIDAVQYQYPWSLESPVPFPREVTQCPACGGELDYTVSLYGHLGHYQCKSCQFLRPTPTVCAEQVTVSPEGSTIQLRYGTEHLSITLPIPGLFNVYNLLGAASVLHSLGYKASILQEALATYHSVFGRAEKRLIDGKPVMILLIKNPVGATEVLKLLASDPNGRLMIALNDNYADGRDVSWIWDAAFELVPKDRSIVVSGTRAEDMAVRLKYAGVDDKKLQIEPHLENALSLAVSQLTPGETLYVLPTYTALLALQKH